MADKSREKKSRPHSQDWLCHMDEHSARTVQNSRSGRGKPRHYDRQRHEAHGSEDPPLQRRADWGMRRGAVVEEAGSVRSGPKYKMEARSFGERAEVPVAREERNAAVDTALGDQRVAETRLAALCQHLGSQASCPLP